MENSSFSRLPAELRNQIYELAPIEKDPIIVKSPFARRWSSPSLIRTCRQFRAEAIGVYYGNNTFMLGGIWINAGLSPLVTWLQAIGLEARGLEARGLVSCIRIQLKLMPVSPEKALNRSQGFWSTLEENDVGLPEDVLYVAYRTIPPPEDRAMRWVVVE